MCSKDSDLLALHQEKYGRFDLGDDDTEVLKPNSLEAKPLAVNDHDGMLVWQSDAATAPQNTLTRACHPDLVAKDQRMLSLFVRGAFPIHQPFCFPATGET
jgi:hypothetical protein